MSADAIRQRAKSIRERLLRPPNAVKDRGIDLSRVPNGVRGFPEPPPPPPPIILPARSAIVRVLEQQKSTDLRITFPVDDILRFLVQYTNTSIDRLKSSDRTTQTVLERLIAIHLLSKFSRNPSASAIGRILNKNHTSILHAQKKLTYETEKRPEFANLLRNLEKALIRKPSGDSIGLAVAAVSECDLAL